MGKRKLPDASLATTRIVYTKGGAKYLLPLIRLSDEEQKRNGCDTKIDWPGFVGEDGRPIRCDWCEGHVSPEGHVEGGLVRIWTFKRDQETGKPLPWVARITCCPRCVYGAVRRQGAFKGQAWSDEVLNVPSLSNAEWTLLGIHAQDGDDYLTAAERIGCGSWSHIRERIKAEIAATEESHVCS